MKLKLTKTIEHGDSVITRIAEVTIDDYCFNASINASIDGLEPEDIRAIEIAKSALADEPKALIP